MKNYENILAEIKELNKTIKSSFDLRTEHQKAYQELKIKDHDKIVELSRKFDLENQENDNKIETLEILKSNSIHVFYHEYLQKIVDTINLYANKRIGEKTKEKLNNEIKEVTNGYVNAIIIKDTNIYIYTDMKSHLDYRDVLLHAKYVNGECIKFWQADGKLQGFTLEQIDYNNYSYIDDIQAYLQERKQAQDKLKEQFEEFNKAREEYNKKFGYSTRASQRASVKHDMLYFQE